MLRHSTAHVMAQAVRRLWPGAKYAIGPVIENGFYYDFELPGRRALQRRRPGADRRRDAGDHQGGPALRPARAHDRRGSRDLRRPALQGGDHQRRGLRCRRGGRRGFGGQHLPQLGRLHRPVPRAARALDGPVWATSSSCGWPVPTGVATRSASSCSASTGPPGNPRRRWRRTSTSSKRRSGVTTASWAPSSTSTASPRRSGRVSPSSTPKAAPSAGSWRTTHGSATSRSGYDFVNSPHITKSALFEESGHLEWFAEGMFPPMELDGGAAVLPEADELPVPHPGVPEPPALLPRAADATLRVRHGLPLRDVGRAPRPHPGARA